METTLSVDACATQPASGSAATRFYVVSMRKFAILYLATFGLYAIYWYYRNWDSYRDSLPFDSPAGKIWPFPRAIFSIFFTHSLFGKIKESAPDQPEVAAWQDKLHASMVVLMLLASNVLDRVSTRSIGSPYTDILGLLILAPLLLLFLRAQAMINLSCNDPAGTSNSRLTRANIAWVLLGAVLWALTIVGLLVPVSPGGSTGQGF